MANEDFKNLSAEEKSRIITEKLFGFKVIYPQEYYAKLRGSNADYWRKQAPDRTEPVVVKGNKDLKTHWIDAYPMPDFYSPIAHSLIAEARRLLFEKDLHLDFAGILGQTVFENMPADCQTSEAVHWLLINASVEDQADAIVKVLLEKL